VLISGDDLRALCARAITPFSPTKVGRAGSIKIPSYGLEGAGYTIRLGVRYLLFSHENSKVHAPVDPVGMSVDDYAKADGVEWASFVASDIVDGFILRPGEMMMAASFEAFRMPRDAIAIVQGKSTYARYGIVVNVTPIEPGWSGVLAMGIINAGPLPVRLYPRCGIAQLMFYRTDEHQYDGAYQEQEVG